MVTRKTLVWIGSSKEDLRSLPTDVRRVFGQAIDDAEWGGEHPAAKALKGFGGRSVLEVVDDYDGDTFRAVYTVRFAGAVYVLHVFQKKAKKGIATPKHELDLVHARLKAAEADYAKRTGKGAKK